MKKNILIIFFLTFFSAQVTLAAPAPWGLALNLETKECAGYWAGDEFVAYHLPAGWKAYYPVYDNTGQSLWATVKTEVGECSFQIRKEEACCLELGYKFVSNNIGKGQMEKLRDREEFERSLQQHQQYNEKQLKIFFVILVLSEIIAVVAVIFLIFFFWRKMRSKK